MSSTASGLNALASTTAIDIYKRNLKEKSEKHYLNATKFFTLFWGCSHSFASVGTLFENLIQLVNIVGSIFYGTVLGIFLVGFYIKFVKAKAIFTVPWSAKSPFSLYTTMPFCFPCRRSQLGYLWLNFIGAMLTIVLSAILQLSVFRKKRIIFHNYQLHVLLFFIATNYTNFIKAKI
jgi:Na+/proline symporter